MYQDEPGLTSEVIQEERSEVNLTQIEDQMEDVQADSEDEAPVFLDLSGFRAGRDPEVRLVTRPRGQASSVCNQRLGPGQLTDSINSTICNLCNWAWAAPAYIIIDHWT